MDNCNYNKAKMIHELGKIKQFIENYAESDAQATSEECKKLMTNAKFEIDAWMEKLQKALSNH